jgi:hypothetical protein
MRYISVLMESSSFTRTGGLYLAQASSRSSIARQTMLDIQTKGSQPDFLARSSRTSANDAAGVSLFFAASSTSSGPLRLESTRSQT